MSHRQNLKEKLLNGKYEEFKSLSICCINDFYMLRTGIKYQVHCDDKRYKISKLYKDINQAVSKFLDIKHKLSRGKRNKNAFST